jgi:hypothetical protein
MTTTTTVRLTRAEAAYAHLASFQRGDTVDITGRRFYMPGIVTQPQQPGATIEDAFVVVSGTPATNGARQTVRVRDLLSGDRTITTWDDAKAGNVRYFDAAGYAAQNPEG